MTGLGTGRGLRPSPPVFPRTPAKLLGSLPLYCSQRLPGMREPQESRAEMERERRSPCRPSPWSQQCPRLVAQVYDEQVLFSVGEFQLNFHHLAGWLSDPRCQSREPVNMSPCMQQGLPKRDYTKAVDRRKSPGLSRGVGNVIPGVPMRRRQREGRQAEEKAAT